VGNGPEGVTDEVGHLVPSAPPAVKEDPRADENGPTLDDGSQAEGPGVATTAPDLTGGGEADPSIRGSSGGTPPSPHDAGTDAGSRTLDQVTPGPDELPPTVTDAPSAADPAVVPETADFDDGVPVLSLPERTTEPVTTDPVVDPVEASDTPGVSGDRHQPRPLPRTMAIANQKGGVGKTTTAVNLGAGLAALGYRVLVIDLDPQGNATTGLGVDARNLSASVYDVLLADRPLEDAVEPTAVRNLFVVPATLDLAGAEIELVPAFSRELKLRRAVDGLDGQFDFILIDCPPSLGLLTVNGLAAADEVLVPVQCEYYALEGLGQLLRNIQLVQSNLNPRLELSTIVLTMYDARTKLSDQVASEVRTHFGARVCRNIVPRSVRLSEAPSFGQPIIVFDPTSRGSIAYRELAKEVSGGAPRRSG